MSDRTSTVYYWPTESAVVVQEDIRKHESNGWYVRQIASVTFSHDESSSLFVVYAKDNA